MKKLVVTAVALIALLSVSGCVGIGKGIGQSPSAGRPSDYDQGLTALCHPLGFCWRLVAGQT